MPNIEFHSAGYFHPDAIVCSAKQAEALAGEIDRLKRELAEAQLDLAATTHKVAGSWGEYFRKTADPKTKQDQDESRRAAAQEALEHGAAYLNDAPRTEDEK